MRTGSYIGMGAIVEARADEVEAEK